MKWLVLSLKDRIFTNDWCCLWRSKYLQCHEGIFRTGVLDRIIAIINCVMNNKLWLSCRRLWSSRAVSKTPPLSANTVLWYEVVRICCLYCKSKISHTGQQHSMLTNIWFSDMYIQTSKDMHISVCNFQFLTIHGKKTYCNKIKVSVNLPLFRGLDDYLINWAHTVFVTFSLVTIFTNQGHQWNSGS
jgi:hypothetical protein